MRKWAAGAIYMTLLLGGARDAGAAVVVDGVGGAVRTNIEGHLSLSGLGCPAHRSVVRRARAQAPDEIRRALEPLGFYRSTFEETFQWTDGCFEARFHIDVGPPTLVRNVRVEGLLIDVDAPIALSVGDVLDHRRYETTKNEIASRHRSHGYLDARFETHRIVVAEDLASADIDLTLSPGRRYTFGEVRVPDIGLDAEYVRRFGSIRYMDDYRREEIDAFEAALRDSEYFDNVRVETAPDRERGIVDLDVSGDPVARFSTSYGLGVSTDFGPSMSVRRADRRRNREGHRYEANVEFSPGLQEVGAQYRIPGLRPANAWWDIMLGHQRQDTRALETATTQARIAATRRTSADKSRTWFLEWMSDTAEHLDEQNAAVTVGGTWTRRRGSREARPMKGSRYDFEALAGFGEATFARVSIRATAIRRLFGEVRGIARFGAAVLLSDAPEDTPATTRLYAGGDTSVRGFRRDAIGPRDREGTGVGGLTAATVSFELDWRLRDDFSVAFFTDTGSVSEKHGLGSWNSSVGVGIRWYSPLGPARLDVAKPLDDGKARLHITFGPDL